MDLGGGLTARQLQTDEVVEGRTCRAGRQAGLTEGTSRVLTVRLEGVPLRFPHRTCFFSAAKWRDATAPCRGL